MPDLIAAGIVLATSDSRQQILHSAIEQIESFDAATTADQIEFIPIERPGCPPSLMPLNRHRSELVPLLRLSLLHAESFPRGAEAHDGVARWVAVRGEFIEGNIEVLGLERH